MENILRYLETKSIFNQRIMVARMLLALGALLTLLFNDASEITNQALLMKEDVYTITSSFKYYSLFNLCSNVFIAKIISIVILLVAITGYIPQITSILQAWVHLSICNSFIVPDGGDQVASNLCLLLIPICLFDKRLNQWNDEKNPNKDYKNVFFNVYFILICLQVSVIYLHAGVGKLYNAEWREGTCVYYWFTNNVFGAPVFLQKFYNLITLSNLSPIFTWSIMIFELGLFACILATDKTIKLIFLLLGLFFHFGIAITHGLISFFFSMAGALILYLDQGNTIYKFLQLKMRNTDGNNNKKDFSDPSYWKFGLFYYNKEDRRLFPPKQTKFLGWTINFANPYSIIAGLGIIILVIILGAYFENKL